VIRGERIDGLKYNDKDNGAEDRPWLAIGQGSPLRVELDQYEPGEDNQEAANWIYTGVGGGPWLVRNGVEQDITGPCDGEYAGSCRKDAAQTIVALSSDGRWLFFVILKKTSEDLPEAFVILRALKVKDAIKMDGGGSSQLYYGGLPGESIEAKFLLPENKRKLSQYLAVNAPPGNGIDLEGSSTPPVPEPESGTDLSWWEQIQKSWNDLRSWWEDTRTSWSEGWEKFSKGWEEFQKDPTKWFDDWLKRKQEELAKRAQEELIKFLMEKLCGSTALVPMTLAAVWIARRRR
jgi:hypothetical protein